MAESFGSLVRHHRMQLGLGLREFADLVGMQASNLSAIEHDQRPVVNAETLRSLAQSLGLEEYSSAWDEFFSAARPKGKPPADVSECFESKAVVSLLRTINRRKPTEEQLRKFQALLDNEMGADTNGLQ